MTTGIYGQDWSSYQSSTPDTEGLSFAFVKVTEGVTYTNPRFPAQRAHAAAAQLVTGLYHYPHMGNSAVTEADRFLAVAKPQHGEIVVLDWEGYDAANVGVSTAQQIAYRDQWLAHVKAKLPHNRVGIYCNTDYWLHIDTTSNCGDFLWIADYGVAPGHPRIQHPFMFHQFTDTPVDRDWCPLATATALRTWALAA